MKTIVFIGSNKSGSSYEALKASDRMNYYTVLLTNRRSFIKKRMDFPYVHLMLYCDLDNVDAIRYALNRLTKNHLDINAIVSFNEPYCHTASLLAHDFGLKSFSEKAISIMLDKIKSREILDGSPYSPFYCVTNNNNSLDSKAINEMPLVLKSPMSSSSMDVHMVRTYQQYENAFKQLCRKYPGTPVLVEKYLEGPQYLVETLTINGKVNIIAIIKQEVTFSSKFIVTGYKLITNDESEFYHSLKTAVDSIIHIYGMQDGPCHLELRYFDNEWKLIEANPRIAGGAMNLFIETAYGLNLTKETLKLALGLNADLEYKYRKETFLQYVVVPKEGELIKVTGKNNARDSQGVEHVYVKPRKGSILIPPISMGYRYAYVIATAKSGDEARENAKLGASKIKFHLRSIDNYTFKFNREEREALSELKSNEANHKGLDAFKENVVF